MPRLETLRKATLAHDLAVARAHFRRDMTYVLRHHVADTDLRQRIGKDLDRLAGIEIPAEDNEPENESPTTPTTDTTNSGPTNTIAHATVTKDQPIHHSPDEQTSSLNPPTQTHGVAAIRSEEIIRSESPLSHSDEGGGLGVGETKSGVGEREKPMSEMSERVNPAPTPYRPPTLEELHNVPVRTTWAGAA